MFRRLRKEEVLDIIEEAVTNTEPGYLNENELRQVAVAVLKELDDEGIIDDREVDL